MIKESTYPIPPSRSAYRKEMSGRIQNVPGCYGAFDRDGNCLYVGKSRILFSRIMSHYTDIEDGEGRFRWMLSGTIEDYPFWGRYFESAEFLKVWECANHHDLELWLIAIFRPVKNKKPNWQVCVQDGHQVPWFNYFP